MRNTFARCFTELAQKDERLTLLYADIGNRLFDPFKAIAPERAINAGIAEANMATMASGMAQMGLRPFIYTITPFTTARNFEQIKIDLAYANVPVVIVGTGSGLAYANLGPTHHSFEDIALMRALPNMTVLCPADSMELEALMPQLLDIDGPVYLRIGKKNEPHNYESPPALTIGVANTLQTGERVALVSTGTTLPIALETADALKGAGVNASVTSMHTVKPLDTEFLRTLGALELVVTIEEHGLTAGFGSALLEWGADNLTHLPLMRAGIPDRFLDKFHDPQSAREAIGLTADSIVNRITKRLSLP